MMESVHNKGSVIRFDLLRRDIVAGLLQFDEFLRGNFGRDILNPILDRSRPNFLKAATETFAHCDELTRLEMNPIMADPIHQTCKVLLPATRPRCAHSTMISRIAGIPFKS